MAVASTPSSAKNRFGSAIRPPDKVTDLGWQWSTNAAEAAAKEAAAKKAEEEQALRGLRADALGAAGEGKGSTAALMAAAEFELGSCYFLGLDIEKDLAKASWVILGRVRYSRDAGRRADNRLRNQDGYGAIGAEAS